jgi:Domain of unknown function (DUF4912)
MKCRSLPTRRKIPLAFRLFAPSCRRNSAMAKQEGNGHSSTSDTGSGFRISEGPVVRFVEGNRRFDLGDVIELPRVYGPPVLFALARDPRTIFTYWNIDWPSIFEKTAPVDRQVHLRVRRSDGAEETSAAAEPMAGSCYLKVSQPRGSYRVEIGYYRPEKTWNSVATSDEVTMPPDRISENLDVDLATIPFHLSFQRLVDLFRASNGDALAAIVARLQKRALTDEDRALLSPEEWEILRAMDLSLDEIESARRAFTNRASETALRQQAEALLGFGATSPSRGFGESSWG